MHIAIVGQTRSGKSTLARHLIKEYKQQRITSLVLDPLIEIYPHLAQEKRAFWGTRYVYGNPEQFMDVAEGSEYCMLFFDEMVRYCDRKYYRLMNTATDYSHLYHTCHYMVHRYNIMPPVMRGQVNDIYALKMDRDDAELLAKAKGKAVLQCADFDKGDCLHVPDYGEPSKFRVFPRIGS